MSFVRYFFCLLVLLFASGCGQSDDPANAAVAKGLILVTGATGTQGGAVARELLARGFPVRALTRNPEQPAARALADAGADVVQGDFAAADTLVAAMQGAHGVFAVTDFWEHGFDGEVAHGKALIDAAESAGIAHFVFSSVAGADDDSGLAHFESKLAIEEMLAESDLAYTILRPVEFMDNWRYRRESLLAGTYRNPRAPTDEHQWIAARDIGFFAGEAFDQPDEWIGRTVEIAGDELSLAELVAVMSEVFGRPVAHQQVSWEDFEATAGAEIAAMNRWFADVGYAVNIESLRSRYPQLQTVRQYLESLAESP
jgi:uncharacterized protein YbjT (DUF2867 family)